MNHYRLLTELPPRPTDPLPPSLPFAALWERCRDELDESWREVLEALVALDDVAPIPPDDDPAASQRARMEDVLVLAEEAECPLLVEWMNYERALREALAARRAAARTSPWPPAAPHVASTMDAVAPALAVALREADPLRRQRAVDALRLQRLDALVADELSAEALVARLVAAHVVERWAPGPIEAPLSEVWT